MRTLRAFHLRLPADSTLPIREAIIITRRRIAALSRFVILPSLWIDRTPGAEQIQKQGDLFCRCARDLNRRGRRRAEVELCVGCEGNEFLLRLEQLRRKLRQPSPETGFAQLMRGRFHLVLQALGPTVRYRTRMHRHHE